MAKFTNQASITYNGITKSSNIVAGEATEVIKMWKDSAIGTYSKDDIMTYVISFQNSGNTELTALELTDNLGAYTFNTTTLYPLTYTGEAVLYYLNGVLQETPTVTPGPPMVIRNLSVLPKSSAVLVFRVKINSFAPLGEAKEIINTATLSGTQLLKNVEASNTITFNHNANLIITKTLSPETVIDGETLTYTFSIENIGEEGATSVANIIIADTFSPKLNNIEVIYKGEVWPQTGNYTYEPTTGLFQTTSGRVTVPGATYIQDEVTGKWELVPGVTTLVVKGTV